MCHTASCSFQPWGRGYPRRSSAENKEHPSLAVCKHRHKPPPPPPRAEAAPRSYTYICMFSSPRLSVSLSLPVDFGALKAAAVERGLGLARCADHCTPVAVLSLSLPRFHTSTGSVSWARHGVVQQLTRHVTCHVTRHVTCHVTPRARHARVLAVTSRAAPSGRA